LTYALWADYTTMKTSAGRTPFQLLYGKEVIMHVELELTSLILALQTKELNSTNVPQRLHDLLDLEEQRSYALDNLKKKATNS
jgi:hypothetical protein